MLVAIIIRQVLEDSILGMGTIKNSWMQLSNPENKIHEEVVKVEISSEGLKALKDEETIVLFTGSCSLCAAFFSTDFFSSALFSLAASI